MVPELFTSPAINEKKPNTLQIEVKISCSGENKAKRTKTKWVTVVCIMFYLPSLLILRPSYMDM